MKNTRKATSYLFWLTFLFIVSLVGSLVAYVSAYFTATANKSGDIYFHDISLEINTANADNALFAADIGTITPGDTLTLSNVTIRNSGTADVYVLVNFNVYITRPGYTDYNLDYWRNLAGTDVNVTNISSNTTGATKLATGSSQTLNFSQVFAGTYFDNTFKEANAKVSVKAVGIQTANLEDIGTITDDALVASYMLVEENYTPTSQHLVDMNQFSTQTVVNCVNASATTNDETYTYDLYNVSLANAEVGDTVYVQAKDADEVFIAQGVYDINTMLAKPEGVIHAYGQTVTSFTLTETQTASVQAMEVSAQSASNFTGVFSVCTKASSTKTPIVRVYVEPQDDLPEIVGGLGVYKIDYANIKTDVSTFDTPMETFPNGDGSYWEVSNYSIVNPTQNSTVYIYARGGGYSGMLPRHTTLAEFNDIITGAIQTPDGTIVSSTIRVNNENYLIHSLEVSAGETLDFAVAVMSGDEEGFNNPLVSVYVQPTENLPAYSNGIAYRLLEDKTGYSAFAGHDLVFTATIPDTFNGLPVKAIQQNGFRSLDYLQSVTIGNNVETIGDYAFDECDQYLSSVSLGNGVKTIGGGAFFNCDALETISIPSSVTEIGMAAFGESGLTSATLNAKDGNCWAVYNTKWDSSLGKYVATTMKELDINSLPQAELVTYLKGYYIFKQIPPNADKLQFTLSDDETYYILSGVSDTTITYAVIPATYNGRPVKEINGDPYLGFSGFGNCQNLQFVKIPSSVTKIERNAFHSCNSLNTVNFEANSQLTTIGSYAFAYCTSLTTISIPSSVTTIENEAFYNCKVLSTVNFEANSQLTTIGNYAFSSCTSLTTISIPSSVTIIGWAFSQSGLTSATLNAKEGYVWKVYNISNNTYVCDVTAGTNVIPYLKGNYYFKQESLE